MVLWWLALTVLAGCLATGVLVSRARSRQRQPGEVRETGDVLVPIAPSQTPSSWRRVGAGMIEGRFGKVSATWPLVVLEVSRTELVLRIRPRFLAAAFGVRALHAPPDGETVAFPVRGWWGSPFVGIRTAQGEGYFRTSRREELLGVLQAAGFQVSGVEQRISQP